MKRKVASKTFEAYFDYFNHIPDFINTRSSYHKVIWDQMYCINENIMNLLVPTCLSNRRLMSIHNINELHLSVILDTLTDTNSMIGGGIHDYYVELFNMFMIIAENNEEFEMAANLKNYYDNFIK